MWVVTLYNSVGGTVFNTNTQNCENNVVMYCGCLGRLVFE